MDDPYNKIQLQRNTKYIFVIKNIFLHEIILVDEIKYLFISCGYTYSGIEREFSQAQLVYLWDLPRPSLMAYPSDKCLFQATHP